MRPVSVVVVDVDAEDVLELSAVDDQDPVEAIAADSTDPAFRERVRVRRPERCGNDPDTLASEDVIEGVAELAVAVVNQEADRRFSRARRRTSAPTSSAIGGLPGRRPA